MTKYIRKFPWISRVSSTYSFTSVHLHLAVDALQFIIKNDKHTPEMTTYLSPSKSSFHILLLVRNIINKITGLQGFSSYINVGIPIKQVHYLTVFFEILF